jgi:uncharacterized membrane protein
MTLMTTQWTLVVINALAASVLVTAGLAKMVSPDQLLRALRELLPGQRLLTVGAVRLIAVVEIATGCALLASPTRTTAAVLAAALGTCFASLGVAGWLRQSRVSCGCLGGDGDAPLGSTSLVLGIALMAVLPVNDLVSLPAAQGAGYSRSAAIATSLGLILLSSMLKRNLALHLLRPDARRTPGNGVS